MSFILKKTDFKITYQSHIHFNHISISYKLVDESFSRNIPKHRSKINTNSATEMGWVFLGQILTVGFGFAILKILSKMGTSDFGIYSLILTVIAFFGLIFYGPIQQGFLRFYYDYAEKNKTLIFVNLTYKILLLSASILLILSILSLIITNLLHLSEYVLLFFLTGIYVFTFKINEFFNSALNLTSEKKREFSAPRR